MSWGLELRATGARHAVLVWMVEPTAGYSMQSPCAVNSSGPTAASERIPIVEDNNSERHYADAIWRRNDQ